MVAFAVSFYFFGGTGNDGYVQVLFIVWFTAYRGLMKYPNRNKETPIKNTRPI